MSKKDNKSETNGKTKDQNMNQQQANGAAENQQVPPLVVNAQYVKDLSFEHPNPAESLKPSEVQPEIDINIDVNADKLEGNMFEVTLQVKANAKRNNDVMFVSEVTYAGIFSLSDAIPQDAVHPVLMIECPRILFPFARSVLAQITREGGFPPLSLNPIDFAGLYQQQAEAAKQQANA